MADPKLDLRLLAACQAGEPQAVALALAHGADPQARCQDGFPARERDPDVLYPDYTALMLASRSGSLQAVEALLAAGADPNASGFIDWTPLILGAGHPRIVEALLRAGADPRALGAGNRTALMFAASFGQWAEDLAGMSVAEAALASADSVALLVGAGSDLDAIDVNNGSAASSCVQADNAESLAALIAAGASLAGKSTGKVNNRAISLVEQACRFGNARCLRVLIAAGAGIEEADQEGRAPLFFAVQEERAECQRALLEAGAVLDRPKIASLLASHPRQFYPVDDARALGLLDSTVQSMAIESIMGSPSLLGAPGPKSPSL